MQQYWSFKSILMLVALGLEVCEGKRVGNGSIRDKWSAQDKLQIYEGTAIVVVELDVKCSNCLF